MNKTEQIFIEYNKKYKVIRNQSYFWFSLNCFFFFCVAIYAMKYHVILSVISLAIAMIVTKLLSIKIIYSYKNNLITTKNIFLENYEFDFVLDFLQLILEDNKRIDYGFALGEKLKLLLSQAKYNEFQKAYYENRNFIKKSMLVYLLEYYEFLASEYKSEYVNEYLKVIEEDICYSNKQSKKRKYIKFLLYIIAFCFFCLSILWFNNRNNYSNFSMAIENIMENKHDMNVLASYNVYEEKEFAVGIVRAETGTEPINLENYYIVEIIIDNGKIENTKELVIIGSAINDKEIWTFAGEKVTYVIANIDKGQKIYYNDELQKTKRNECSISYGIDESIEYFETFVISDIVDEKDVSIE